MTDRVDKLAAYSKEAVLKREAELRASSNRVLEVATVIEAIGALFPSADEPTGLEKAYGDAIQDAIDVVARLSQESAK